MPGSGEGLSTPYGAFAQVYDRAGFSDFSRQMLPYALRLLEHLGWEPPEPSALDLACGTGTAALELARRGWRVTGVDGSAAMLEAARDKATASSSAGGAVDWILADMRTFRSPRPHGLVTCFFDALNYLLEPSDLIETFRRVREALLPGGVLVFDMNTVWGLQSGWGGEEVVEVYPDLVSFMRETYEPGRRLARVRLSFYVEDAGGYRRIEEVHLERGYTLEEIEEALVRAGLGEARFFDCLTLDPAHAATRRVAVAARSPA
ncbi:class I SAM-dependent DNA methyltransferase [Limnochorda pilosa]|uniref:Methyltransferase type 11 n=1 Tax=Limnochorda pilosa TaxID=1555112 RepID=A0A0K2SKN0_LIMPI|nr:class I SAM-dependent methyltransferase [Limnochorda pilosa]BAS27658.1 methyltransferase type 11 [Limnochorda pilosa]